MANSIFSCFTVLSNQLCAQIMSYSNGTFPLPLLHIEQAFVKFLLQNKEENHAILRVPISFSPELSITIIMNRTVLPKIYSTITIS